ncbi:hypothetical protein P255_00074 [Acinetobacter brisouii CIP 110357]|uniref:Lipoprotein n=1 Tax=Acinetobacter brisouii CIP 110357 TaxID=1341683 RepID=V2VYZ2_9GAMM|nr:hypothetical protein [Acinetobacter brisouii]ENV48570.1 hypothetical protein F954_00298 [Acinetobacter brisouii ANC 4119]ESK52969.1 hypothetical protein P255_00074 [Acinetobacter brisouii CIP 110357]
MRLHNSMLMTGCCITLIACSQTSPILKGQDHWIGTWQSPHSELKIQRDGQLQYHESQYQQQRTAHSQSESTEQSEMTAPITVLNTQYIQAGTPEFGNRFKIDKAPYLLKGHWHAVIDGQDFIKK